MVKICQMKTYFYFASFGVIVLIFVYGLYLKRQNESLKSEVQNLNSTLNQNLKQIEILSQNIGEKEVITKEIIKFKDKVIYESKSDFCVNSANFAIKRLREKERND